MFGDWMLGFVEGGFRASEEALVSLPLSFKALLLIHPVLEMVREVGGRAWCGIRWHVGLNESEHCVDGDL